MEVEDANQGGGDPDEGGKDPDEGDSDKVTLNLPADMVLTAETDPGLGNTYIAAEKRPQEHQGEDELHQQ